MKKRKSPTKAERRRSLAKRDKAGALLRWLPTHQVEDTKGRWRTAWLMIAVHSYRVLVNHSDSEVLASKGSHLRKLIPPHDGCGWCAVCRAVVDIMEAHDLAQPDATIAAICSRHAHHAVRTKLDRVCGVAGIVIARATELAYGKAKLTGGSAGVRVMPARGRKSTP